MLGQFTLTSVFSWLLITIDYWSIDVSIATNINININSANNIDNINCQYQLPINTNYLLTLIIINNL